ncbi:F-box/LRR-repeat protein 13-like isoform X4 [Mizuhopecten yessoensis]|uniref:F-box/LRR-repeat protein 13-like isoform X4 n=1 Tax=Mizuhopecten yessoensis TaxID=6573 RepID=UPI000B45EDC9|nr:F-box/LRR-repeat protein 13-like isoform X4 [Mizuhopecten yessoensis]
MAASMKGQTPELKLYLRSNKLPDIYEALLTGLAVMCPGDPHQFILDKLGILVENGLGDLNWDMFVDSEMKPVNKIITESSLDFIFNMDDESIIDYSDIPENIQKGQGFYGGRFQGLAASKRVWPTPEMYASAYEHYNRSLKMMCFSAWVQYSLRKKKKMKKMSLQMERAERHRAQKVMRVHLDEWKDWVKYRKGCQAMSYQKIKKIYNISIGKVIFKEWHETTVRAKNQREYFESKLKLERGENMEDDETFGQGTGEARDSISHLRDIGFGDLAVRIFSFVDIADLARCSRVCRSWKVITQTPALWSRLDFYKVRNRMLYGVTDQITTRLLAKCRPYLIHLNLRGCVKITEPTFVSISECRNLQDLNLSECKGLNDEHMKVVAKGCKILLYLNISHTGVTDASLRTISKYCANLQFLSMASCCKYTDKGLQYLASGKSNKKLEYLDLSGCLQVTPEGFQNLASGCSNIHTLILNDFATLNDDCLKPITAKCFKLQNISILGSPLLTDESFRRLAQRGKLKKLRIEGNHRISDQSLKVIGKNCTQLEHIYVADCQKLTDLSLKALSNCKNLVVCNVADVVRVTDSGVKGLVEGPATQKIRELNLTNCIRVGDMSLIALRKCHSLTHLSVCYCEHIAEAGVELLGQIHSLTSIDLTGCNCGDNGLSALGNNSRLKDVTLSECTSITDLGLQKFTQQCKDIERLDLSHCVGITDGAIKNLAFCCRMLNVLNVAGCKLVTNLSIQYLSGVCHYLYSLDISGCLLVTEKALKYLRKGCKKLHNLTILYCKGIPKSSAQKMMRSVEVVRYSNEDIPPYYGYVG